MLVRPKMKMAKTIKNSYFWHLKRKQIFSRSLLGDTGGWEYSTRSLPSRGKHVLKLVVASNTAHSH